MWGSRGEDEHLTLQTPKSDPTFSAVLQLLIVHVLDKTCEHYMLYHETLAGGGVSGSGGGVSGGGSGGVSVFHKVDMGLFFNTCMSYLRRCPLILLTCMNDQSTVIKITTTATHCIGHSLEVFVSYVCIIYPCSPIDSHLFSLSRINSISFLSLPYIES